MRIQHSLSKIEEMEEFLSELEERQTECGNLRQEAEQAENIWKQVYGKYGRKLERIRGSWQQPVTKAEIQQLKQEVFDESIVTRLKRFFGLKEKQLTEYNSLMDRLDFLRDYTNNQVKESETRMEDLKEGLGQTIREYEDTYRGVYEAYSSAFGAGWEEYHQPEEDKPQVYIGDMTMEITDSPEDEMVLKSGLHQAWGSQGILAPCILDLETPVKLGIVYSNDMEKQKASGLVRSIIFQVIRHLPLYQYQFTCLDYKNSGSYLGELRGLEKFVDTYAEGIRTELFKERYQMLTMAATEQQIGETLDFLEWYIDSVSRMLGGTESAAEYNQTAEKKIPHLFFIMDAYPEGLNDGSKKRLSKLLINGSRCGISVIVTMGSAYQSEFEAAIRDAGLKNSDYGLVYCGKDEEELSFDTIRGPFLINDMYERRQSYVDSVMEILNAARNVDNRFESVFDLNAPFGQGDSTKWITVPFTINARGRIGELYLGSHTYYANALLSGSAGSGKSTLLHMLINSMVMNYTPEDVQLWLVDYKLVEFSAYVRNTPPHVKFVGLDRSEEFTFAFLDHMKKELDRRLALFKKENVANITDYKKKFGKDSLARIVIIIDEFHVMTNQIQGTDYTTILEEFLKEARAAGMVCVFSDQVVSTGLRGLTEAGRMQIRTRLAMSNDQMQEIRETLAITAAEEHNIRPMGMGEVTIKRFTESVDADGNKVTQTALDCEKVVYITDEMREYVCQRARETFQAGEAPIIVDGKNRVAADWDVIRDYDRENMRGGNSWLHLGKPSNLERCFCIRLRRNFGQNLISIGEDEELQASVLFHAIASFRLQPERKIYILADENDDIFLKYETQLRRLGNEEDVELITDYGDICRTVCELQQEMYSRRRVQKKQNIMVFWLGMDNMALEFSFYPEQKPESLKAISGSQKKKNPASSLNMMSELDSMFASFFGDDSPAAPAPEPQVPETEEEEEEDILYNATEDIAELVGEGPKRGIHHFLFMPSFLPLKKARFLKLENFLCKIGFQMDEESSVDYFGKRGLTRNLEAGQAACYDGGKFSRNFLPYKLTDEVMAGKTE